MFDESASIFIPVTVQLSPPTPPPHTPQIIHLNFIILIFGEEYKFRSSLFHNFLTMSRLWISAVQSPCTAILTLKYSTFCPHSVFMCFVWISEQTALISLYSINWLVCITEAECVYCVVQSKYLCVFLWIWEQTVIISLYSIKWLVFITEMECVYCAVWIGTLNASQVNLSL